MSVAVADLARLAGQRGRRAWVLGRLLVEEPDAEAVGVAASVPTLAEAFADPDTARADYAAVLLHEVPCHESVFTGPDGQMGRVPPALLTLYRRWDFAPQERGYRAAAEDHLGLQLLFLAHLCEAESSGWADDRPDEATRAVEAQRALLANHLGWWGPAAAHALARAGTGTAYAVLGSGVDELLAEEFARLRPAPKHPGIPPIAEPPAADRPGGVTRTARRLLAPATAGGFLTSADIGAVAAAAGAPWRPSDTRSRLRHVLDAAAEGEGLEPLAAALEPIVAAWVDHWAARERANPGAGRTFEWWRQRAEATAAWVGRLPDDTDRGPRVLRVTDHAGLARALVRLSAAGVVVTVDPAPADVAAHADVVVRVDATGRPGWEGDPPPGVDGAS